MSENGAYDPLFTTFYINIYTTKEIVYASLHL
jgi:hypothetical protein